MIYVIFSDLHSNLEALNRFQMVLKDIPHDKLICLGDSIGYGANPNECVDWIRENADLALAGNHDYAVLGKTDLRYFNPYAYKACLWTQKQLSAENREYLEGLVAIQEFDGMCLAHSSPYEPYNWHYIVSSFDGLVNFENFQTPVCFVGHSHRPVVLSQSADESVNDSYPQKMTMELGFRYIVNVGSLGQPRDGNPLACFVEYDSESGVMEFHRLAYDIESCQQKILQEGLPVYLAERLREGL